MAAIIEEEEEEESTETIIDLVILWIVTRLPPDWQYFQQRLRLQNKWQSYGYKSKKS